MATNSNKQNNTENNNTNLNNNEDVDKSNKNLNPKKDNNKKGSGIFSLITVFLILILAAVSVISYLPIRNSYFPVEDNVRNYLESNDFTYSLSRLTRELQQFINTEDNGYYGNRYINAESVKYKVNGTVNESLNSADEGEESEQIDTKSEVMERTETSEAGTDTEDTENLEFDKITIEQKSLSNLGDISDSKLEKEIKDSLFYMRATFDENGEPEIETSLDGKFDKDHFIRNLTYYTADKDMEGFANLNLLYIVPQDFEEYDDVFTGNMKDKATFPDYATLILVIGAVSILILIIAAFAVPYSAQNNMSIARVFNKMFLELKFFTWGLFAGLCAITAEIISNNYGNYGYSNSISSFIYDVNPVFYAIGIALTFIFYLLIYLNVVYIKYIYHNGLKKGLIENSLFGGLFLYIVRNSREAFKRLTSIDLREDNYGKLVGIVIINLLAIWILGSGGFLGFIISVAYTIFIFKYLLKMLDKAEELNRASSKVAEGNFNINVNEDMGILSPMAKNLNNIKQGFSLAIEKETKSQRMKSELISNVSHDLKTPLTSIITYVDLLKKEDTDEETKKEYIEILDKKSQRLKVLIEDLFEASKATSGNVDLKMKDIDIIALFKQTLGELEEKINESNLDFKINLPETKVICNLDGRRTYRVFENIITNTLKYSMENSRVYIDALENEDEINFIFKNVSAYEMNFHASEITERFTRGDESRNTEGSGLGLSIAKSFVELQEGSLDIVIDGDLFKLIVKLPKSK